MVSIVKVFTINTPRKHDLCCAICNIINSENDTLIYPEFCLSKRKCREFLREMPRAMAAPGSHQKLREIDNNMYIIVEKELFEDYSFKNYCNMRNIQVMDLLNPIPTYIYKKCLLFTLECKLAPQWNKVGPYLVEGQDFLSSTENVNAMKMTIKEIYDNRSRLYLEAINLKIPFIKLDSTQFLKYDNLYPPIHVLPSMKMADILCVSKTLKEHHPFKNYEELREYWKNVHGYILPEYEEGLLFYDVKFFYFKQIFVYPATCLTSGPLKVLPFPTDPVPLIYNFVADLKRNVGELCGLHFDVYPEELHQVIKPSCTSLPTLSRSVKKILTNDTGYDTQSRRTSNVTSLMSSTCDIPTKRPRLSLVKSYDTLICEAEIDDFDFSKPPTCKFAPRTITDKSSAVLHGTDNTVSYYFSQEKQENENESYELKNEIREKKSDNLSLKEKLFRDF